MKLLFCSDISLKMDKRILSPPIFYHLQSVPYGKDVPVLLTEHHTMMAYWGSRGIAPHILDLTSALDGGKWFASHTGHFTPGKETLVPTA
jgi:hypothetical protein